MAYVAQKRIDITCSVVKYHVSIDYVGVYSMLYTRVLPAFKCASVNICTKENLHVHVQVRACVLFVSDFSTYPKNAAMHTITLNY